VKKMGFKEKLKKISDYEWELPKGVKPGMRVPARLFLSEKLLREVEDGAIEQIANVAFLPGIHKHSIALPDMHFGYGFPLGGVAALDCEEGGLSPGGIGFDINCIARDSKILTRDGYRIEAKNLPKVMNKIKLVTKGKSMFEFNDVLFVAKRKKDGRKTYRIVTELGREIIVSEDHPVFCVNKIKQAKELRKGDEIIIYPFEGVEYEENRNEILSYPDFKEYDKQVIRKLEKCNLLPLTYSNPKIGILARLVGYVLGDGCVARIREKKRERLITVISGAKQDLELIRKEISLLGFKPSKVYTRERVVRGYNYYGEFVARCKENWIRINSKTFSLLLNKLGVPIGRKTICKFNVPKWIKQAPLWVKRNFLAALFGQR
jgi:tRNA-splicing ligase RtcB